MSVTANQYTTASAMPMTPVRPGYRIPPTPRETLEKRASSVAAMRAKEAQHNHTFYEVRAYDRVRNVVYLQMAGRSDHPVYEVDMDGFTCTCPDCVNTITRINIELMAAGLCPGLMCKHPIIVAEKQLADPDVLDNAPEPLATEPDGHVCPVCFKVWPDGFAPCGLCPECYWASEDAEDDATVAPAARPEISAQTMERDFA